MTQASGANYTQNTQEPYTDIPVGEILRRTRVHYGQSYADVENSTRIRAHIIEALEKNDIEKLPSRFYVIGFLRSYAEYLGLDGERLVELFKQQFGENTKGLALNVSSSMDERGTPPLWVIGISIFIVTILVAIWNKTDLQERKIMDEIPSVPLQKQQAGLENPFKEVLVTKKDVEKEEVIQVATNDSLSSDEKSQKNAQTQSVGVAISKGIILNVRANSWVEILDEEGERILSRVLNAGDQYFVPDRPDLTMSLGNAGGVDIEVGGEMLRPLGNDAEVKRNIMLDAKYLKNKYSM